MKQSIYVTYDYEMKVYDNPFLAPIPKTDIKEQYRRQFFHQAKKAFENNLYSKDLFFLGEFDEVEGTIELNKEFLFHLKEVLPDVNIKEVAA